MAFQLFQQSDYCHVNSGILRARNEMPTAQRVRAHTFKLYVEYENEKVLLFTRYKENDVQSTE
jgi:hypothetical protein